MRRNNPVTRTVIYARYSSDNQREASIADQVELSRRYCTEQGWDVTEVYEDPAISGGSSMRPGFQKMLGDAEHRRFDVVVTESIDRLGRRLADVADLHDRLSFLGIRLFALNVGEVTPIHTAVMGMMAQHYVKDLAQKTKRGQLGRALKGKLPGGKAFGYDVLPADADGAGHRRINEAEAAVVTRIFEDYAQGQSPRTMARVLNEEGVPGPEGRPWGDTTIRGQVDRGTGILNNTLYVGELSWNRCSYVKDPHTGKRVARVNPREQWEIVPVPDLRIIDDDLWGAVKARQQSTAYQITRDEDGNALNRAHRRQFLLSGLLVCGVCGGGYTIVAQDRYGCATRRAKGTCGNGRTIKRQEIEARVLDGLKERLITPELVQVFMTTFQEEVNKLQAERARTREAKEREFEKTVRELEKLVDALAAGVNADTVKDRITALEVRKAVLAKELSKPTPDPIRIHPSMARLYAEKVADLETALNDPAIKPEASEVLRSMISRIELTPREDEPGLDALIHGDLAEILAICETEGLKQEHPALLEAGRQLSVVAGVGFEPTTFRL
jgi:site-specific DNA recombinase